MALGEPGLISTASDLIHVKKDAIRYCECKLRVNSMFEANFSNSFPDPQNDLASEEQVNRSEDLLRCLRLGIDVLQLLSALDVIFV